MSRRTYIQIALASALIFLAVWWVVVAAHIFPEFFLPSPAQVLATFTYDLQTGVLGPHLLVSLTRIVLGFVASLLIALPLGIMLGVSKRAEAALEPVIDFIRYMPIPALIPLFILWFGIGETEKVVVIFSAVFFQLVLMIANRIALIPQHLVDTAKTLGASDGQVIRYVTLPHAAPGIVDDIRVSMGWAWSSLILAEVIGASQGLGYFIVQSQRLLQTPQVIVGIILIGLLGLATDYALKWYHQHAFPWMHIYTHD